MKTTFRLPLLLVLGLALSPVPGALAYTPVTEQSERVADARGLNGLTVENSRGRTEVRASADGRIHVTAVKICRASRDEDARRISGEITVETAAVGPRYVVRVHYPARLDIHLDFWELFRSHDSDAPFVPQAEVRLVLEVPRGFALDLAAVSGDFTTDGIAGAQQLHTTSGDVAVSRAAGRIDVRTVSGDVSLNAVSAGHVHTVSGDLEASGVGAFEFETTSGDARIDGARDSLRLRTSSGDLAVSDAPRGIDARTVSGEIGLTSGCGRILLESSSGELHAGLHGPLTSASLASVSGDVVLALTRGLDASLELSTTSGELSCSMPVQLLEHDRTRLRASIGRGGPLVRLQSSSGDLNVTSEGK